VGSLLKHGRRFKWIPTNVCEDARKPRYKVKVRAFIAAEVAAIVEQADESTALLIRTAAHAGSGSVSPRAWSGSRSTSTRA
jgi:hypothetical protein